MTDLILHNEPQVLVVFDQNFPDVAFRGTSPLPFPLADILRDGDNVATIADRTLLERVANHFDFGQVSTDYLLGHMVVRRPSTGNITVESKPVFG